METMEKSFQILLPLFQQSIFRKEAGNCFYQLSAINYDFIIKEISKTINLFTQSTKGKNSMSEEEFLNSLELVAYLHMNIDKLFELMGKFENISKNLKKINQQGQLAEILCTIIWNWIKNYTIEFLTLTNEKQTSEHNLSSNHNLFFPS